MQHLITIAERNFYKYNHLATVTNSYQDFPLMMLYWKASNYWFKKLMELSLPTHQLTIVSADFNNDGQVTVKTHNGNITVVSAKYLNDCTGCDVQTLAGAVGEVWD